MVKSTSALEEDTGFVCGIHIGQLTTVRSSILMESVLCEHFCACGTHTDKQVHTHTCK